MPASIVERLNMIYIFLIIQICLIIGLFFFIKDLEKNIKIREEKIEKEFQIKSFEPYLGFCFEKCDCFNEEKEKIGEIEENTFHTIVWEENDFCKMLDGRWIKKKDISTDFQKTEFSQLAKLNKDSVLLNGPSLGYQKITDLPASAIVAVKAIYGAWAEIVVFDNVIGFTLKNNLIPIDKPA